MSETEVALNNLTSTSDLNSFCNLLTIDNCSVSRLKHCTCTTYLF